MEVPAAPIAVNALSQILNGSPLPPELRAARSTSHLPLFLVECLRCVFHGLAPKTPSSPTTLSGLCAGLSLPKHFLPVFRFHSSHPFSLVYFILRHETQNLVRLFWSHLPTEPSGQVKVFPRSGECQSLLQWGREEAWCWFGEVQFGNGLPAGKTRESRRAQDL